MPSKSVGAGIVDVTTTVVDAVLVLVVMTTVVDVTLLVVVYVEVVENVLVTVDAVVVTVFFIVAVVVVVVVAGVTVLSGVEAERTTITSTKVLVDDVVGIGVLAEVLVSFVTHCTVCDVDELTVAVKVRSAMIDSARVNRSNIGSSMMSDFGE